MELLDTDVLIDVQRGHPPALAWLAGLTALPAVPGFVVMELIQDARNSREIRQAFKLVAPLPSRLANGEGWGAGFVRFHDLPPVARPGLTGRTNCGVRGRLVGDLIYLQ